MNAPRDPRHRVWAPATFITCKDHGLRPSNEYCDKCVASLEEQNQKLREALDGTPEVLRRAAADIDAANKKYAELFVLYEEAVDALKALKAPNTTTPEYDDDDDNLPCNCG